MQPAYSKANRGGLHDFFYKFLLSLFVCYLVMPYFYVFFPFFILFGGS